MSLQWLMNNRDSLMTSDLQTRYIQQPSRSFQRQEAWHNYVQIPGWLSSNKESSAAFEPAPAQSQRPQGWNCEDGEGQPARQGQANGEDGFFVLLQSGC